MNTTTDTPGDLTMVRIAPILSQPSFEPQRVLFVEVHRDDVDLLTSEDGAWLRVLYNLDWRDYRPMAAQYYQGLWDFNAEAARKRAEEYVEADFDGESHGQARLRLLRERPTEGNKDAPILYQIPESVAQTPAVREELLSPGVVPFRLAGRRPKCFFGLFKAFEGIHLMGRAASAEEVNHHLRCCPPFRRACGFTMRDTTRGYRHTDIPGLRKLEQFDQIMSEKGIWAQIRIKVVRGNLEARIVNLTGENLVHDTTHFMAYSAMDVVEKPQGDENGEHTVIQQEAKAEVEALVPGDDGPTRSPQQSRAAGVGSARRKRQGGERKKGKRSRVKVQARRKQEQRKPKVKRKSQSRTLKRCRCKDRDHCPHLWTLSDAGAGTVVKGGRGRKKYYWAHKAAVLSTGPGGVPLDAIAVTDSATHDGQTLLPHLRDFFARYPELRGVFANLLADTAYDDEKMKKIIERELGLHVRTDVNPRSRKPQTEGLGRGMKTLSPIGTLTCWADQRMTYLGCRRGTRRYIYGPPVLQDGGVTCPQCPLREKCCRRDTDGGRYVEIPFAKLSHIDVDDPPMARRFRAMMRYRTSVERAIKRIKLDFGSDRLSRRGNEAFQAHLDRSLTAYHLLLRYG